VDTGADINVISDRIAERLGISLREEDFVHKVKEVSKWHLQKMTEPFLLGFELEDDLGNSYSGEDYFHVVERMRKSAIVGRDFVSKYNVPIEELVKIATII